jgi:hypothetical protein
MGNRISSGKFRTTSTCNGHIPVCNVSKTHDLCSNRQHCSVRTSRNAGYVKEWHARHILTTVCHSFSPYCLFRRCTAFVVDADGLRGPNEGQCPIWKQMFVQIKEYAFPRTWQVVHVGTSPERQVAVVTKLWTMVPNIFASCQSSGAFHFEVAAMFVGYFSTPDLNCN